ncbi:MAG: hypothetical protein HC836_28050 [Richelia sp. RM2_1_2]|nr:hypothetical protein [Richelia sp. RM2_1_2]
MVDLPNHDADMREQLGISKEAIVLGRHGGIETFDILWVKERVIRLAKKRSDVYFLFMNTEKFSGPEISNIIYLEPVADLIKKTEFINSCDAMLHARSKGETFGLAVAEFSLRNKPVITYNKSLDMAHGDILGKDALYYSNQIELDLIFDNLDNYLKLNNKGRNWNKYAQFSPENVINKFNTVFLK